jgi:uncharacterized delta-60 repeat protein
MEPAGETARESRSGLRLARVAALAALALAIVAAQALGAAGALDPSFSGDGKRLTTFAGADNDFPFAVAIQPNRRIVVAGNSEQGGGSGRDFAIARYNPDGSLDHSFSGDGKRLQSFDNGANSDRAEAVAVQRNGKIVVAGFSNQGPSDSDLRNEFAIARYNPDGGLDHSFSGDGKRLVTFGSNTDQAFDVAVQPNGKIVIAGESIQGTSTFEFALARLHPGGSLDHSFSGDGKRLTVFPSEVLAKGAGARGVAIQRDGRIVLAGLSLRGGASYNFAIARYTEDGNLDGSFSGDGKRLVELGDDDNADDVVIQPNGRIVIAGNSEQGSEQDVFAIVRLRPGGGLDHSFSGDGKRLATFAAGSGNDRARGVALQRDGKLVVVGGSDQAATGTDFAIARFKPGGGLDHSFSGDGKRLQSFDNGANSDQAQTVAVQGNGRIVVAGSSGQPAGFAFAVARFLGA